MKNFSPELLAFLLGEQGKTCWKADLFLFQFPSGQTFGATSAQIDITFGTPSTTYYASKYGSWTRGKVTLEADFQPKSNETTISFMDAGASAGTPVLFPGTSASMISAILQGFFDGAQVSVYTIYCPATGAAGPPHYDTSFGPEIKFVGTFTRAEPADRISCNLTAADPLYQLNANVPVRLFQQACPFTFGDSNCGFDLTSIQETVTVASFSTQTDIFFTTPLTTTRAAQGFLKGADNSGLPYSINTQPSAFHVTLRSPMLLPVQVGNTVIVSPACNKTQTDCAFYFPTTFLLHFGGTPYVPVPETLL